MAPVVVKSTAVSILLLTLAACAPFSIGQNSDLTHMRLNVIDRHHVESFINRCWACFH